MTVDVCSGRTPMEYSNLSEPTVAVALSQGPRSARKHEKRISTQEGRSEHVKLAFPLTFDPNEPTRRSASLVWRCREQSDAKRSKENGQDLDVGALGLWRPSGRYGFFPSDLARDQRRSFSRAAAFIFCEFPCSCNSSSRDKLCLARLGRFAENPPTKR